MNDFVRRQGIAIIIQFIGIVIAVLLAYGTLKQDIAVQNQRIVALELRIQDTATKTDIQNLRADIRELRGILINKDQ